MLFAAHCLSVILMLVEKILKRYRLLLVCSNFLRTVPINLFYLTTMIYCIYKNRIDCRYSDELEEYVYEIWIQFEIQIFFSWLYSTMIFLIFVYFTKFNSNWKQLDERLNIEDVWDSKNSKDILHFFKFENDVFSVICCFLINDFNKVKKKILYHEMIDYYMVFFMILRISMIVLFIKQAKFSITKHN